MLKALCALAVGGLLATSAFAQSGWRCDIYRCTSWDFCQRIESSVPQRELQDRIRHWQRVYPGYRITSMNCRS